MIIGVTGFFAAGKDSFANYLIAREFLHISLSDIIRAEVLARGMMVNLTNLTDVGNALRKQRGNGVLAQIALEHMQPERNYVVTSIRHPDEIGALRSGNPLFHLVFLNAPIKIRYERSHARERAGDFATFEEFARAEKQQMENPDPAAQQLLACRAQADTEMINSSTIEALHRKIDELLISLNES